VGDDLQRTSVMPGEHLQQESDSADLAVDTVRSDLTDDTAPDLEDERTATILQVPGASGQPSGPVASVMSGPRTLLAASEEVTRASHPHTLPPPRPALREVYGREGASARARPPTGRQPAYVPDAVRQRESAPRVGPSAARLLTPPRGSMPPAASTRPPPLRDDNPIAFGPAPAATARRPPRSGVPWWTALAVGVSLGFGLSTAGFVAWMLSRSPARPPATVAPPAPPPAPSPAGPTDLAWAPSERRIWQGSTEGDGARWGVMLSLHLERDGSVRGYLAWSAVAVANAPAGEQVRENVEGTWDAPRGLLTLRGTASTNPSLVPTNRYQLRLTAAGALRGGAADGGTALALALRPLPEAPAPPAGG
jgi:hypothetical protein